MSDAALTPYHAIKNSLGALAGGGRFALVIGLGGLGQMGVQILGALSGATVIATDTKPEAMELAESNGALCVGAEDQVAQIRGLTGGRGVDVALDFVGASSTIALAQASMAPRGRLSVVGIANGAAQWSFFTTPYESTLSNTYWGTLEDLFEVVDMYRARQIRPQVQRFTMDEALEAYRRLEAGELLGRAVVTPNLN